MKAAGVAEPAVGDAYLVAHAQEGYIDAYELLVQRYSATAYRVALRLTGNHHDAQDVAQEALIAAWENLARFRAGSSFSTWLYQIVTRRALNKVSRGRAVSSLELLPDVAGAAAEPAEQAERNLAVDAVTDALLALPFPQRVVVVLHHFEGLSYAEVAAVTALARDSARMIPDVRVALGRSTQGRIAALAERATFGHHHPHAAVGVLGRTAVVDLAVAVTYEDPVHEVARNIQRQVTAAPREQVGLQSVTVNVTVDDILGDEER